MYERSFQFSHRPFTPAPDAALYIATGSLEQARQTLVRTIERAEGPGLVVGSAGSGKSLLCQVLAKHFRDRMHVALLSGARLGTLRALLQNILFELKLPYRDMDENELRLSLLDHLEPRGGSGEGLLLLVDEAHSLPLRLLEEIRLLTNVVQNGQSRVRLVLAGSMALEERLASPKLESFQQRIAARCYLQSLTRDETMHYVQEQIRRANGAPDRVFAPDALRAIHTATDGIPRLINQVCDHALILAALGGHARLTAAGIEEAWADLQQLPAPFHEPARTNVAAGAGVVEFGQLGDADDRPAAAAAQRRPRLGEAAVARLDAIHRTIDSLADDEPREGIITGTAADDFSPALESGTEVDLVFHNAHDPFGSHWEEEEVVIDRYASLEDAAIRNRKHATSAEGRAIGAAVSAALDTLTPADSEAAELSDDESEIPAALAMTAAFHPASDPLMPEESTQAVRPRKTTISLRSIADDDRDMIVVDNDVPQQPAPRGARPRRPEYRQLFSNLRNKV